MSELLHICTAVPTAASLEYLNMLGYFLCQLFLCRDVTKNCTSCKIAHRDILRTLFMCQLTTILRVGGLGVEDQRKGLPKVPVLLHVIFCAVGQKRGIIPFETKEA